MSTTTEMRMRSLERAQGIRIARAELKQRIARGEVFAASVLLDPPPEAETWPVGQLLVTQREWGVKRMRKLLGRLQIPEVKPIAALTDRQRRVLARTLGWREEER